MFNLVQLLPNRTTHLGSILFLILLPKSGSGLSMCLYLVACPVNFTFLHSLSTGNNPPEK
ncbi:hypothetical protein BLOT_006313 [Blomia tropicalis]|nr:hypothetical protein BLOT_006313 [Blomia tropicalis]